MAKVSLQVRGIVNLGLWDKVCEYHGWDKWLLSDGRISEDEWVEFDDTFQKPKEQKKKYEAIVKINSNIVYELSYGNWTKHVDNVEVSSGGDGYTYAEFIEMVLGDYPITEVDQFHLVS